MSGALFFFFWSAGPPAPPPPPPPPPDPLPGSGGGHGKGKGKGHGKREYVPLSTEFWDERERYLRTLFPEEIEPAPPPDNSAAEYTTEMNRLYEERKQQLEQLTSDRSAAILALRSSADIQSMQQQGARITAINDKISDLMGKQAFTRFTQ